MSVTVKVQVQKTATSTAAMARLYQKGGPDQTDILLQEVSLSEAADLAQLLLDGSRYIVIQDAGDTAKSIDNW